MNLWGPAILLVNILHSASGQQVSWKELEGRCYAVIHTKAPFPSNNIPNVCYPYGAEPIKLKRQLEMEFVQTILAGSDLEYWVGSKYNSTTREYYWDNNDHQKQPLPSMWLRNKPDFSGHCVRLTTETLSGTGSGNTYGLADGQCSSQLKTVCEKQANHQSKIPRYITAVIGNNCFVDSYQSWSWSTCANSCARKTTCTGFRFNDRIKLCSVFRFATKCDEPSINTKTEFFMLQPRC